MPHEYDTGSWPAGYSPPQTEEHGVRPYSQNGREKSSGGTQIVAWLSLATAGIALGAAVGSYDAYSSLHNAPAASFSGEVSSATNPDGAKLPVESVVTVAVNSGQQRGIGSAVALDSHHLVTNAHVVTMDGAVSDAKFEVQDSSGVEYTAKLVGLDRTSDIAVLEVAEADFTPMEFAESAKLQPGTAVTAIGAPLGLANTVTRGTLSANSRVVTVGGGESAVAILTLQTDAAINSGNSGGALLDDEGRLIGINAAIATSGTSTGSIGIGYAIPSEYVARVAKEILEHGEATHGQLGAKLSTATSLDGNFENGARVDELTPGEAAEQAGLRKGDVLVKFGDRSVASSREAFAAVREQAAGATVEATIMRGGKEQRLSITLGEA